MSGQKGQVSPAQMTQVKIAGLLRAFGRAGDSPAPGAAPETPWR